LLFGCAAPSQAFSLQGSCSGACTRHVQHLTWHLLLLLLALLECGRLAALLLLLPLCCRVHARHWCHEA
jgi:hypothetical protein